LPPSDPCLLALERLVEREWFDFYRKAERRVARLRADVEEAARQLEARASRAYAGSVASFPSLSDGGPETLDGGTAHAIRLEREVGGVFAVGLGVGSLIHRRVQSAQRELHREGARQTAAHLEAVSDLSVDAGLEREAVAFRRAASAARGSARSGLSSWAMERDLEVLAVTSGHRAALNSYAAGRGGRLSRTLRESGASTRMSRRSLRNSTLGSARRALRASVYAAVGAAAVFDGWRGVRPYPGGGPVTDPHSEEAWANSAKRSSFRSGNPVSGYGLHVGSKTYFAPALNLGSLAVALCRGRPGFAYSLVMGVRASLDTVSRAAVLYRGRAMNSLADLVLALREEVAAEHVAPRRPGRDARVLVGEIRGRYGDSWAIDIGRDQGVRIGDRFEVYPPGVGPRRGVLGITALYPDTATGYVVIGDILEPRLFDRVALKQPFE